MCGIAGIAFGKPTRIEAETLDNLRQSLAHRGPDDWGVLTWSAAGVRRARDLGHESAAAEIMMVHLRLSILDLTQSGWQPMSSTDGNYHVVFNGEIYNFVELREELARLGHTFRSDSDTEVLLAAFVEWGVKALDRLVGMFAFAMLDTRRRRLLLARDPFGIKPLYYAVQDGSLAFASEIPALLRLLRVSPRSNPERLYTYLRYGITDHGDSTLFDGVYQLPPAHYLQVDLARLADASPTRYWDVALDDVQEISFEDAACRLRELFLDSVRLHLRSDVPLGTALSGGIDSTAIVMAIKEIHGSADRLHTFSFVPDDDRLSEESWVDLAARASGAIVHKVRPTAEDLVRDLEMLVAVQGEPFTSTSMYAQYRVFQLAREQGITVMLNGQGADELLGGYRLYVGARLASLIRQGQWRHALRLANNARTLPATSLPWLVMITGDFLAPRHLQQPIRKLVGKDLAPSWMNAEWFADRGVVPSSPRSTQAREVLRNELYRTLFDTNLPHLLRYEDRNSMAFSIESRVPFLTPAIAKFVLSLPEQYIVSPEGTSKSVFRAAMRGLVPDPILDRRDKVGFATPQREWLISQRSWVERLLGGESAQRIRALNIGALRKRWQQIASGDMRNTHHAWRWINVLAWADRFNVEMA